MSQNSKSQNTSNARNSGDSSPRGPKQIESDLESNRSRMDEMLDQLQAKFSPDELIDQAKRYARRRTSDGSSSNLQEMVVRNPLPVALIGVGMAWLLMAGRNGSVPQEDSAREGTDSQSALGNRHTTDDRIEGTHGRDTAAEFPTANTAPRASSNRSSGEGGREQSAGVDADSERGTTRSDAGRQDQSKRLETGGNDQSKQAGAGYSDPSRGPVPARASETGGTSGRESDVAATRPSNPAPR